HAPLPRQQPNLRPARYRLHPSLTRRQSSMFLLTRRTIIRGSVGVKRGGRLHPPGLTAGAFGLGPAYRLPVRRKNQITTGRKFNAVAARFIGIEKKGLPYRVFVRTGFNKNAILGV